MANPYHDGSGKFCSKGEMSAAIDNAAKSGDFTLYASLREDYEKAITAETVMETKEQVKAFYEKESTLVVKDGNKYWNNEAGDLHRTDGPAVEEKSGTKAWYQNGKRHREDGPAVELADGGRMWFQSDILHREDGPAYEYADGTKEWYVHGIEMREPEKNETNPTIMRTVGEKQWFLNGKRKKNN